MPWNLVGSRLGLGQDLEIECPKLAIVNILGVRFLSSFIIYEDYNHKHLFYLNKV